MNGIDEGDGWEDIDVPAGRTLPCPETPRSGTINLPVVIEDVVDVYRDNYWSTQYACLRRVVGYPNWGDRRLALERFTPPPYEIAEVYVYYNERLYAVVGGLVVAEFNLKRGPKLRSKSSRRRGHKISTWVPVEHQIRVDLSLPSND